ncbi:sulfur oxidation c-type cytochrome SoxX [Thiomicrorhabdus sp. Kp2]|uniref:sulfur oxidation c-type cytochrome SoxX n=1 Tax=Thiomicrorhabdus sp. Kp2 TaxID=1123518 RepID=UPI0004235AC2|nr:sulfur oxidation c-type cytochrome SoxX [Thiomicrorhabdus sp. Kp2]
MKDITSKSTFVASLAMAAITVAALPNTAFSAEQAASFDKTVLANVEQTVQESWTRSSAEERKRLVQDYSMKVCTQYKDKPTPELAKKLTEMNRALIQYPKDGIKLGDWKAGEKLASSGYGMRIGTINPDDPKKKPNGGNCYACHALSPSEPAAGNLGPKLTGYGSRGTSDAMMKYTYEKIYNAHAFYACSGMPRFGVHNVLSDKQISDIMAFLMDPKSSVNQK